MNKNLVLIYDKIGIISQTNQSWFFKHIFNFSYSIYVITHHKILSMLLTSFSANDIQENEIFVIEPDKCHLDQNPMDIGGGGVMNRVHLISPSFFISSYSNHDREKRRNSNVFYQ